MQKICDNCGNSFETPYVNRARFCSRRCAWAFAGLHRMSKVDGLLSL